MVDATKSSRNDTKSFDLTGMVGTSASSTLNPDCGLDCLSGVSRQTNAANHEALDEWCVLFFIIRVRFTALRVRAFAKDMAWRAQNKMRAKVRWPFTSEIMKSS